MSAGLVGGWECGKLCWVQVFLVGKGVGSRREANKLIKVGPDGMCLRLIALDSSALCLIDVACVMEEKSPRLELVDKTPCHVVGRSRPSPGGKGVRLNLVLHGQHQPTTRNGTAPGPGTESLDTETGSTAQRVGDEPWCRKSKLKAV